jgi:hypothetical protein
MGTFQYRFAPQALRPSRHMFALGMAAAAGTALALEITESAPHTAAFRMALFSACLNLPVAYMPAIDGWGNRWGVRGVAGTDAVCSLASVAVCALIALAFWPATRPAVVAGMVSP